ncbi:MAG: alpha-amylase family glycosyl hydrolase [Opitutales bacterium]
MQQSHSKISDAFWESQDSGLVILSSDWPESGTLPPLFLGPVERPFQSLERLDPETCGRYYRYYRKKGSWFFRLEAKRYPPLFGGKATVYLAGGFNDWEAAIGCEEWMLSSTGEGESMIYRIQVPEERLPTDGKSAFKFVTGEGAWLDVPDSAPNLIQTPEGIRNFEFNPAQSGRHIFRFRIPPDYEPAGNEKILWRDDAWQEDYELPHTQFLLYAKTELPLGALVEKERTVFRLFAPRAECVRVSYGRKPDGSDATMLTMKCVDGVTWEGVAPENLDGWFYSFRVEDGVWEGTSHFDKAFPVLDPYAKACMGCRGPGIIVAPERFEKVAEPFTAPAWHDLVILEGHVRDLVAHAPVKLSEAERRGFAGLRKWIREESSYLREIGVNALELQPVQEFDNQSVEEYHWGYMPVNYFSPESSYALEPEKASQIEEFRDLVAECHAAGLAVIIDVVYNHVGEPNHLLFIDKYYYFHLDEANDLLNWSGCGNDLRCEAPMVRRLIVESLKHLVEAYDVDGFRFDLAELIGAEVLAEVEKELKAVKPSIILIAEPWSFRGDIREQLKPTGFASWNDGFRDFIAQYVRGAGARETIRYFLSGSPAIARFAAQTINYTESHDDHCWLDRITECAGHDGIAPTPLDRRRTHLMAAVLFCSLGVPMLAEGQDFLRSKRGVSNTYQRGDLNALDENRRLAFSGTHEYFRGWIRFRLSEAGGALRYDGALTENYLQFFFEEDTSAVLVIFNADNSRAAPPLLFGINPHDTPVSVPCSLPGERTLCQIADHERFDSDGLGSAWIRMEKDAIHLPPMSCGLWRINEAR